MAPNNDFVFICFVDDNAENIVDVSTPVGNRIRAKANDQIGLYVQFTNGHLQ